MTMVKFEKDLPWSLISAKSPSYMSNSASVFVRRGNRHQKSRNQRLASRSLIYGKDIGSANYEEGGGQGP
jgi:hypothetical protein